MNSRALPASLLVGARGAPTAVHLRSWADECRGGLRRWSRLYGDERLPEQDPGPEAGPRPAGQLPAQRGRREGRLNGSIADAGWGVFLAILNAKAESAGREVMAVDPRNTSRRCPECGHTARENRPTQETFHCVACGHSAHADTVGALNVLRAGLVRREAQPAWREAPSIYEGEESHMPRPRRHEWSQASRRRTGRASCRACRPGR
jgi:putative transposase